MAPGGALALALFAVSLTCLPFALAACFAGSDADDSDDALIKRLLVGDPRLASARDEIPHAADYAEGGRHGHA